MAQRKLTLKRFTFAGLLMVLAGCSSDPYRGIYEGIQSQNDARRSAQEKAATPTSSYDAYKKEREKIAP